MFLIFCFHFLDTEVSRRLDGVDGFTEYIMGYHSTIKKNLRGEFESHHLEQNKQNSKTNITCSR